MSDPDLPSVVRGAAPDVVRPPTEPGSARGRSVSPRVLAVVALALAAAGAVAWLDVKREATALREEAARRLTATEASVALARSREDGYTRAALDVAESNPRARALYEGMGFRLVATRRAALPERWGERVVDHHYLECAL